MELKALDEEVIAKKEQTEALETLLKTLERDVAEKEEAHDALTAKHSQTTQELARHRLDLQVAAASHQSQAQLQQDNVALGEQVAELQAALLTTQQELARTQRELDDVTYHRQSQAILEEVCACPFCAAQPTICVKQRPKAAWDPLARRADERHESEGPFSGCGRAGARAVLQNRLFFFFLVKDSPQGPPNRQPPTVVQ